MGIIFSTTITFFKPVELKVYKNLILNLNQPSVKSIFHIPSIRLVFISLSAFFTQIIKSINHKVIEIFVDKINISVGITKSYSGGGIGVSFTSNSYIN